MEGSSNSNPHLNALTPSCDGDNSSVNEGCESPFSSWDSEPEADIQSVIDSDDMPEEPLEGNKLEENNLDDGLLWEMDNRSYEELLKKYLEKEEELRVSNFKLTLSEQEIIKLNVQVENGEAQLNNVREELKLKEEELNKQKELLEEEINKLKIQIEKSENWHANVKEEFRRKVEKLEKQIDKVQEELKLNMEKMKNLIAENWSGLQNWWNKLKIENRIDNVQKDLNQKVDKLKTKFLKIGQDYKFGKTTSGSS
ncbi:hypothetical protein L195_g048090 [Trifolium pratense]|uniref:Uncharacterized protein n=2 Tax=Trifolium pratense TaxID=57577 RepID=A0A2K3JKB5_TRIPR|nr:tropomyosin-like [Trifolium pratense]PNX54471.1 hypothetical protein L195_g048090 [Trifolium pratense]